MKQEHEWPYSMARPSFIAESLQFKPSSKVRMRSLRSPATSLLLSACWCLTSAFAASGGDVWGEASRAAAFAIVAPLATMICLPLAGDGERPRRLSREADQGRANPGLVACAGQGLRSFWLSPLGPLGGVGTSGRAATFAAGLLTGLLAGLVHLLFSNGSFSFSISSSSWWIAVRTRGSCTSSWTEGLLRGSLVSIWAMRLRKSSEKTAGTCGGTLRKILMTKWRIESASNACLRVAIS